ncbi:MAG: type I DNA topoisomerase [Bacteroidaceae bacterium]|nr:type I DNA topoisomerase [Bacteroidaceae bacterium]
MAKNLVIVESPAKAKTIERFLGKDYKVLSSKGHIRDLKKKNFGVDLETFRPQYEIPADKADTVKSLRTEAKKADKVWLASDEDREGEAIAWHLAEVLGLDNKSEDRIVFHEITKHAIEHAIEHPRAIDLALVDAQQARRVLDRLVGFKLSPVLWRKVKRGLSAGRVQSVAVRLVVEREREIEAFQTEVAYRVTAVFRTTDGQEVHAAYSKKFKTQEQAEAFLQSQQDATFSVAGVQTKPVKRSPAPPFTTSTLQQEAARRLGFPVSQTMRLAQSLYEAGHITYMRTDSTNLSTLCLNTAGKLIEETMGKEYHKVRRYRTGTKGAQEAHEAIRPTYIDHETAGANAQERRLYDLIRKRTLACQMADAQLERTVVTINTTKGDGTYTAQGEVITFEGFLRVYHDHPETDAVEKGEEDNMSTTLPRTTAGDTLSRQTITATERFTQPPARYNEATLVRKLEELGIGRPSTYAPTISTIQQREYVARGEKEGTTRTFHTLTLTDKDTIKAQSGKEKTGNERGRLIPTDLGLVVNDFLTEHFPGILDYGFTADVEKEFDAVAEGKADWTDLMRRFYADFEPQVEKTLEERTERHVGERVLGEDPATGLPVSVRIGRYGPMVQIGTAGEGQKPRFATMKRSQSMQTITLAEALDLFRLPRTVGEYEGKEITAAEGRFGPYVKHGSLFASIPKGTDPLSLTLDEAIDLIEDKRRAEREKHIKQFPEDPALEILKGRWGPYISHNGENYRIPKTKHDAAATLTYQECLDIINSQPTSGKTARKTRKK